MTENKVTPLVSAEFSAYDTTPDGVLYFNEFNDEKLDSFVLRYVSTDDAAIRKTFVNGMNYPLWDAVKTRIQKLVGSKDIDPELKTRIENIILKYEFSDQKVRGSIAIWGDHSQESETSGDYSINKEIGQAIVHGGLFYERPFNDHRIKGTASLEGGYLNEKQTESLPAGDNETDHSYFNVKPYASLLFQRLDDKFKIFADTEFGHYFSAPPDHLLDQLVVNGSIQGSDIPILGHPFSIKGSAYYLKNDFTSPSTASGFFTIGSDKLTAAGQATYGLSGFGIVIDYSMLMDDSSSHESLEKTQGHSFAGLVQFTKENDYVRFGVSGGWANGEYQLLGSVDATELDIASVGFKMDGKLQLHSAVYLQGLANVSMQESGETFFGWYPSWAMSLLLGISPKYWDMSMSVAYEGDRIDLNETRARNKVSVLTDVSYRPLDWLKFSAHGELSFNSISGYDERESKSGKVNGNTAVNMPFWNALWVALYGGYYGYDYNFSDQEGSGSGWWIGANASVDL